MAYDRFPDDQINDGYGMCDRCGHESSLHSSHWDEQGGPWEEWCIECPSVATMVWGSGELQGLCFRGPTFAEALFKAFELEGWEAS